MNDKVNWRVHSKQHHNRRYANYEDQMAVVITKAGDVGLSRRAWQAIGSPEAVILLSEDTGTMVGFRRATVGEFNAYKVNSASSPSLKYVAAKSFVEMHPVLKGLMDTTKVWSAYMEGDVLAINLNASHPVTV